MKKSKPLSKSLKELEEKYYGKKGTTTRIKYEKMVAKDISTEFINSNPNLKKFSATEKKGLSFDMTRLVFSLNCNE